MGGRERPERACGSGPGLRYPLRYERPVWPNGLYMSVSVNNRCETREAARSAACALALRAASRVTATV